MEKLTLVIDSNEELLEIIGTTPGYYLVHKFMPQQAIRWQNADITINGLALRNADVRDLQFDLRTDFGVISEIISLNTQNLVIYQFDKPIAGTLVIEHLPEKSRERILQQNGLQHIFEIHFEFLTITSSNEEFLNSIKGNAAFSERIIEK